MLDLCGCLDGGVVRPQINWQDMIPKIETLAEAESITMTDAMRRLLGSDFDPKIFHNARSNYKRTKVAKDQMKNMFDEVQAAKPEPPAPTVTGVLLIGTGAEVGQAMAKFLEGIKK